jgi:hypothetical protein
MKETNPVTEEVKKVAEETGAQVENVAEGTISKKEMDSMERALNLGAEMIIKTLKMEGVELTDEQKNKVKQAYQASFAISALLMK